MQTPDRASSQNVPERLSEPRAKEKAGYFTFLGLKYMNQLRLLMRGGGLTKTDKWDNVARHCLVQLAAAEELCEMMGLSEEETEAACRTSAIHDWEKRFEKTRDRLREAGDEAGLASLEEQWKQARWEYFWDANPRQDLLDATKPEFLAEVIESRRGLTFHQRFQLYLDMLTDENTIMATQERYEKVRNSPRSKGLEGLAGGRYWEGINTLRLSIEREFFHRLQANNVDIGAPADIPIVVQKAVERRWDG